MRAAVAVFLVASPFASFAACSSSSAGGPAGSMGMLPSSSSGSGGGTLGDEAGNPDMAASCASSPVVWKDDGTERCASSAEAILGTSSAEDFADGGRATYLSLEIAVVQAPTSYVFSFIVTSSGALTGTYSCALTASSMAELTYDEVGVFSTSVASCTVTLTAVAAADGGMVASGTFSAVLDVTDGGTKNVTDGTFDLPITQE